MGDINRNNTNTTLFHWQNLKVKLLVQSVVVGGFSGLLVALYRISLEKAEGFRTYILSLSLPKYILIPSWFLILLLCAYIVGLSIKNEPLISGSGIPQIEGVLLRKIQMNWLSILPRKFLAGVISIAGGLSLGKAGPSIQFGAAIGQGISKVFKRANIEEKYLITSGAAAGLAAVFNAPLAGVMFVIEEMHKHFSPLILLPALCASLTADLISKSLFSLKPAFNFKNISSLPPKSYGYIVLLGVIVGTFGAFYNYSLLKTQNIYGKQKWLSVKFRPMIPFLFSGVLALTFPQVLGGGQVLIDMLIEGNFTIKMLLIVLCIKFIFSMLSYGSGVPGGIFFPVLVLGALTGAFYGNILVYFTGFDNHYINNFVILATAGYFTAVVRTPITAIILIAEITGSFSSMLPLGIVSLVAYIVADLLKSEPICQSLLYRLLKNKGTYEVPEYSKNKVILEIPIWLDSVIDGKSIKEINLPNNCLLVCLQRGSKELIPHGSTVVQGGDYLSVLVDEGKAASTKEHLLEISSKPRL